MNIEVVMATLSLEAVGVLAEDCFQLYWPANTAESWGLSTLGAQIATVP